MDRERWSRIEEVFARATDVAADQRRAFVARECADDLALRRQVERLLAADATGGPDALDLVALPWSPDGDAMVGRQVRARSKIR